MSFSREKFYHIHHIFWAGYNFFFFFYYLFRVTNFAYDDNHVADDFNDNNFERNNSDYDDNKSDVDEYFSGFYK